MCIHSLPKVIIILLCFPLSYSTLVLAFVNSGSSQDQDFLWALWIQETLNVICSLEHWLDLRWTWSPPSFLCKHTQRTTAFSSALPAGYQPWWLHADTSLALTLRWKVLFHLFLNFILSCSWFLILFYPGSFLEQKWNSKWEKLRLRKVQGDLASSVQNVIENSVVGSLNGALCWVYCFPFPLPNNQTQTSSCFMSVMLGFCSSVAALGSSVGHHCRGPAPNACS